MYFKKLILLIFTVVTAFSNLGFTSPEDEPQEILFTREGWRSEKDESRLFPEWITVIYKLDLESLSLSKVADGGNASIGPDGNTIVYEKEVEAAYVWAEDDFYLRQYTDIYITNFEGTSDKNLTNTPHIDEKYPKVSPSGNLVSYINTDRGGYGKMCFINIKDDTRWCLDDMDPIYNRSCNLPTEEWSDECFRSTVYPQRASIYINVVDYLLVANVQDPSETVIVLSSESMKLDPQRENEIFAITIKNDVIYSVQLIARGQNPSLSADGTKIFYLNDKSIYYTDVQGLQHQKVLDINTKEYFYEKSISVSSDNKRIAYQTDQHVYISNIDGSENKPILWSSGIFLEGTFTHHNLMYLKFNQSYATGYLYMHDTQSAKSTRITFHGDVYGGADYGVVLIP